MERLGKCEIFPLLLLLLSLLSSGSGKLFQLELLERTPVCEVEDRFLSVAMSMNVAKNGFKRIDYSSEKLRTLLRALKPAYFRLGGSASNFLFFKVGSTKPSTPPTFPDQKATADQFQLNKPTPPTVTNAPVTTNVLPTGVPDTAKPSSNGASNNGPLKPTAFTPRIPEKPTPKPGNDAQDPQSQNDPTGNGLNQGTMDQSNGNQNQDQGAMGQGQPPMQPTLKPPNSKQPSNNKENNQQEPDNGYISLNLNGNDPENPSDALDEYMNDGKSGLELKNQIASMQSGSGSGDSQQGSGDGSEAPISFDTETDSEINKRFMINKAYPTQPFWLMSDDFDKFYNFIKEAGLDLVFNLGDFVRYDNGSWNATNALEMFHHVAYRGYKLGWQLGNDPDRYKKYGPDRVINATQAGNDTVQLRKILRGNNNFGTLLIGPDITFSRKGNAAGKYLREYLKTNASYELSAISWHQYYVNGRKAIEDDLADPDVLDKFKEQVQNVRSVLQKLKIDKPLWLTETGSASSGGAPGLSDTFLASFMYLDKLGVAGVYCNSVVARQSILKGGYALLSDDYSPRPDYWLALLHKRLVGKRVLLVSGDNKRLRAYAHCTRNSTAYKAGSVTVFVLNLRKKPARIEFGDDLKDKYVDQFLVTSSDGSLTSKSVMLNSEVLEMRSNTTIPNFQALKVRQPMKMPSYSYAFYVIPDAAVKSCM
ncbi:heparanase-like [Rhopilema esculentum]|uniref:heparanase-like n=1 Tax=Rhopilema esculentum TaxID=499914 RepID=UPI0031CE4C1F|eukprot:gene14882-6015_t